MDGRKAGPRVTVDSTGRAAYAASSLVAGEHTLEAWRYERPDVGGAWIKVAEADPVRFRTEIRVTRLP